jgi:hypothetical protein
MEWKTSSSHSPTSPSLTTTRSKQSNAWLFKLQTDASNERVGCVLCQEDDNGVESVVGYDSKAFSGQELNWQHIGEGSLCNSNWYWTFSCLLIWMTFYSSNQSWVPSMVV